MEAACCPHSHFSCREKLVAVAAGRNVLAQEELCFYGLLEEMQLSLLSLCPLLLRANLIFRFITAEQLQTDSYNLQLYR